MYACINIVSKFNTTFVQ